MSDRRAHFFRGATALECGDMSPLWEQALAGGIRARKECENVGLPGKFQICYQINLITLATYR
ncbi:MAG: hypothetical protein ACM3NN_14745 [Nitrospirota bacterium]|jgi:hypothetical protein